MQSDVEKVPEEEACDDEGVLDWVLVWLVLDTVADVGVLELELDIEEEPEVAGEEVTDDNEPIIVVELEMTEDPELPLILVVLVVVEDVEVGVPVLPDVEEEPMEDKEEELIVPLLVVPFKLVLGFRLKMVESPVLVLELLLLEVLVDELVPKLEEDVVDDCVEVVKRLMESAEDIEVEVSEEEEVVLESVVAIVGRLVEELEVLEDEVEVVDVSVLLVAELVEVLMSVVDVEEVVRVDELDELHKGVTNW
ncbi:hypothetical protein CSPX01_14263 [Colletotrichum filicis]|nr:hypothetical protein CSPX01_14263 [Colletotrichum filicis]